MDLVVNAKQLIPHQGFIALDFVAFGWIRDRHPNDWTR
jgi:hypothetical protein